MLKVDVMCARQPNFMPTICLYLDYLLLNQSSIIFQLPVTYTCISQYDYDEQLENDLLLVYYITC